MLCSNFRHQQHGSRGIRTHPRGGPPVIPIKAAHEAKKAQLPGYKMTQIWHILWPVERDICFVLFCFVQD